MSPVTSDHSLVEALGAPPRPHTPNEVAAVQNLLDEGTGKRWSPNQRGEMESMLFDDTTLAVAPAAAAWHPKHEG